MARDYLLQIEGIKGESKDKAHKDTIELHSFSWGVTNPGTYASNSGGGAGKGSFQDLHCSSTVNKASPNLAKASASGKHISKAILYVRKAGGKQQEYYTVTLEDILISGYQSGGSGGDILPMDSFSLNYAKIKFEYKPQKDDQTLDSAIEMTWNLKAGDEK